MFKRDDGVKVSFNFHAKRMNHLTLLKAPMAHKKFSKEQFTRKVRNLNISIKSAYQMGVFFKGNPVMSLRHFILIYFNLSRDYSSHLMKLVRSIFFIVYVESFYLS